MRGKHFWGRGSGGHENECDEHEGGRGRENWLT